MRYLCDNARHLICVPYSVPNLHAMAVALGIARCWYHGGRLPHYDMPKRRVREIRSRCEVVTSRELVRLARSQVMP